MNSNFKYGFYQSLLDFVQSENVEDEIFDGQTQRDFVLEHLLEVYEDSKLHPFSPNRV